MGFWSNIFGLGNLTANSLAATPGANVNIGSASANISTFGSSAGLFIIGIAVVIVMATLLLFLSDWEKFKKMKGFIGWLVRTFGYFLYGALTIIIVAVPLSLVWFGGGAVVSNPVIGEYIGGAILVFFAISGVGFVLKPIYNKIGRNIERSGAEEDRAKSPENIQPPKGKKVNK